MPSSTSLSLAAALASVFAIYVTVYLKAIVVLELDKEEPAASPVTAAMYVGMHVDPSLALSASAFVDPV